MKIPKSKKRKHFVLKVYDIDKVKLSDTRYNFLCEINKII